VNGWLAGRNGLVSNSQYAFWQPDAELRESIRVCFEKLNVNSTAAAAAD
jgi:hypothetical protein